MKTQRIIITAIILCSLGLIGYLALSNNPPAWTGFGERVKDNTKEAAKTLWDWLDLLIIPIVISLLGWAFSQAEKTKASRSEEERAQNESLDSFFNTMTKLIIEYKLTENPSRQTKTIARTRINLVLNNLNGNRKGQVLQYLYESDLIDINPKLKLLGANLRNAILDEIVLGKSEIKGAYFNQASIQNANLNEAVLVGCNFTRANFSKSLVTGVDLSYTDLTKAKLKFMDLTSVNFEGANLTGANLKGSKITKEQLNGVFIKDGVKISKKKIV
jgi:uncharacterized protein YjbI with pentapeptide repeats